MNPDERAIRELFATWLRAIGDGDIALLLPLLDEDVVFISPGQPLMRGRDAYATELRTVFETQHIEAVNDIQEITVSGSLAYCWNYLRVTLKPVQEGVAVRRSGYTLTVLRKDETRGWRVYRDANLVSAEL